MHLQYAKRTAMHQTQQLDASRQHIHDRLILPIHLRTAKRARARARGGGGGGVTSPIHRAREKNLELHQTKPRARYTDTQSCLTMYTFRSTWSWVNFTSGSSASESPNMLCTPR